MLTAATLSRLEAVPGRIIVAYSGGCDSHALLHLLHHSLTHPVEALHVNHGLSGRADAWQAHCESVCDALEIPFTACRVDVKRAGSLEANARDARYQVFERQLQSDDLLVLGHHQDDQVETILLNMLSGRAPLGIQGMPGERALGRGRLFRPLLDVNRGDLRQYAADHDLQWIEDASNADTSHDRNYLRREVIPKLATRWPNTANILTDQWRRTSRFLVEQALEAGADFESMSIAEDCIDYSAFAALSDTRAAGVLRYWLHNFGAGGTAGKALQEAVQVLRSEASESPAFELANVTLQRYRSRIILLDAQHKTPSELVVATVGHTPFSGGQISADTVKGRGVSIPMTQLQFRTRRRGDKLLVSGHHKTLKNLFQESGYPPLVRDRIPLIIDRDQLIGICGIPTWGIDMVAGDAARVTDGAQGNDIHWLPHSNSLHLKSLP